MNIEIKLNKRKKIKLPLGPSWDWRGPSMVTIGKISLWCWGSQVAGEKGILKTSMAVEKIYIYMRHTKMKEKEQGIRPKKKETKSESNKRPKVRDLTAPYHSPIPTVTLPMGSSFLVSTNIFDGWHIVKLIEAM